MGRVFDPSEEPIRHPLHDGFPDRILAWEMPKQSALRDVHLLGDGGCGDVARIPIAGQLEYSLNGYRSPLDGGNAF